MHTGSIGVDGHHFKGGPLMPHGRALGRAGRGRILDFWPFVAGHSPAGLGRAGN